LIISNKRDLVPETTLNELKEKLDILSRKIYNYSNSLEK
jgi:hypothetical protein